MVSHVHHDIVEGEFMIGYDPEGEVGGSGVSTEGPRKVGLHVGMVIEETPDSCIAETSSFEVGFGVGVIPTEVFVFTLEPAFGTGE